MSYIFNCDVKTITSSEGPALGAAIIAGVCSGQFKNVEDGCAHMIEEKSTAFPEQKNHRAYENYYSLYKELYPALKKLYKVLASI